MIFLTDVHLHRREQVGSPTVGIPLTSTAVGSKYNTESSKSSRQLAGVLETERDAV